MILTEHSLHSRSLPIGRVLSPGDEPVCDDDHQQRQAVALRWPHEFWPGSEEIESVGDQLRCGFLGVPHVQVGEVTSAASSRAAPDASFVKTFGVCGAAGSAGRVHGWLPCRFLESRDLMVPAEERNVT